MQINAGVMPIASLFFYLLLRCKINLIHVHLIVDAGKTTC
jgi:hypothetical protein